MSPNKSITEKQKPVKITQASIEKAALEISREINKGITKRAFLESIKGKTLKAVENVKDGKSIKTKGVKDFLKQMNE